MSKSPPKRKTAVVHPLGFPKQKSFATSFQRGSEENFSSLPTQRPSLTKSKEVKPLRKSKSVQISNLKYKLNTTSPSVKVVPDDKEDIVTGSTNNNNENVDNENNHVGYTGVRRVIITKPLLDIIDDLCSGANSNCDRKKLSQEQRRKSLSKERTIGIQQFFKYSSIWGNKKEL